MSAACQMLTVSVCGVTAAAGPEAAPRTASGANAASNAIATKPAPTAAVLTAAVQTAAVLTADVKTAGDFPYIRLLPKPPRRLNFPNPVNGTESADRRRRSGSRPACRVAQVPAAPGVLPG